MPEVTLDALIPQASAADVFDRLRDFAAYPKYTDAVREVSVTDTGGDTMDSDWSVNFRNGILCWSERDRINADTLSIDFTQTDGDFDTFDGKLEGLQPPGRRGHRTLHRHLRPRHAQPGRDHRPHSLPGPHRSHQPHSAGPARGPHHPHRPRTRTRPRGHTVTGSLTTTQPPEVNGAGNPVTAQRFKDLLAHLPTPVTVLTTCESDGSGAAGMTASAVCSLSLDPPLILACADNHSRTLARIRTTGAFAVNVLREEQAYLAKRFADGSVRQADRFAGTPTTSSTGCRYWMRRWHG